MSKHPNDNVTPLNLLALRVLSTLVAFSVVRNVEHTETVFDFGLATTNVNPNDKNSTEGHPLWDPRTWFSPELPPNLPALTFDEIQTGLGILVARGFVTREPGNELRLAQNISAMRQAPKAAGRSGESQIEFMGVEEARKHMLNGVWSAARIPVEYDVFVRTLFKMKGDEAHDIHHAATGLAGEGGELLDASKKHWIYNTPWDKVMDNNTGQTLRGNVLEELGDSFFYFTKLLQLFGFTLDEVIAANRTKLMKRYEGVVYSDTAAQERKDKAPDNTVAKLDRSQPYGEVQPIEPHRNARTA